MKNEKNRVLKYEKKYLRINKLLKKLDKDLDSYLKLSEDLKDLSDYYDKDWMVDYDNSDEKANILSQDALWDMFQLDREVKDRMKDIID